MCKIFKRENKKAFEKLFKALKLLRHYIIAQLHAYAFKKCNLGLL